MIKPGGSHKRQEYSLEEYVAGIKAGDISILSRAITLVESTRVDHRELSQQIIEACIPFSGNSIRIGITGVPGVGKSTFIESFGKHITAQGKKLAVLAIDPSSEQNKGSILGDKTRMEALCQDDMAFIRPSPAAGSLGGVARKTRESILLCEAAGYDIIIVETVGVGQSETAVHSMVDFFLLLMLSGAGDELQGIKRGIMEMADTITITKADGDNTNRSKAAVGDYKRAIHLFPPTQSGWIPKVLTCSALQNEGIQELWECVASFVNHSKTNNFFDNNRKDQAQFWLHESIQEQLGQRFYHNPKIKSELQEMEKQVVAGSISPFTAASKLIALFQDQ